MSIFTAMSSAYSLEEAFGAKDCTTEKMKNAIREWFKLYYEQIPTKESDPCQRIAYTVVHKLTKTCFGEYNTDCKDDYAQGVLDALNERKKEAMQLLLAGGSGFLKPIPFRDSWAFSFIQRDNFLVFGRDATGTPNDVGTIERTTQGRFFYTLLERRSVDAEGRLTIRNTLYQSSLQDSLGKPVELSTLAQYAALEPEYTYPKPMGGLGLVYMQVPIENVVDGSQDGVAVYAAAVGLIRNIDRNRAQINGEFDRGQSKVFASADLMRRDKDGKRRFDDDIFVALDDSPEEIGVTIFSPELRYDEYRAREQDYLRQVENIIGIKRGLISEVEAVDRTATEITSSEGDYNLTIIDLQEVWTKAVHDAVKLCGILGGYHEVPGAHEAAEDTVSIDWGNGVLFDEEKAWAEYMSMVSAGMLKPEIALGWKFGKPTETEADLQKIRKKYMPDMEAEAQEPGDDE